MPDTVLELLDRSDPSAAAIGAPGRSDLTYAELAALIGETAGALNGFGIGRNDAVAIVLPNGPEMATAFLGVAAGATAAIVDIGPFSLLETMRLADGRLCRLDLHLDRAAAAAHFFGIDWNSASVAAACDAAAKEHTVGSWRARLLIDRDGRATVDCTPYTPNRGPRRVAFSVAPIDDQDPFLYNKTTRRSQYEMARRARPDVEDVLLWNARGEVTESTIANVIVEIDGILWTPPVASGLLAGVFRRELLRSGSIRERVLTRKAVAQAPRLWLVNSLREWMDVVLVT